MRNILIFCLLLCACKRSPDYGANDFKLVKPNYKWINLDSATAPIKCLDIINGEIIAVDNANNLFSFDAITKTTKKIISNKSNSADFISPQEIFALSFSKFIIYDLTSDSFFEYLKKNHNWLINKTFQLDYSLHGLPSISPVSNNQFVATSINNIQGKLIVGKIDPKPSVQKYIGEIEKKDTENKYITAMVNRSSCVFDKWTNNIFVGNFYSDNIECYNLNGDLKFRITGPDNFEPIYRVKKIQGDQVFINTPKTKNAFISITSDKKYIYALYSGKTFDQPVTNTGKTIYIFEKTGHPVKKILLTSDIGSIKTDEASHSLYCYFIDKNPKTQILVYDTESI